MYFPRNNLKLDFKKEKDEKVCKCHYRENKLIIRSDWKFCVSDVCRSALDSRAMHGDCNNLGCRSPGGNTDSHICER